jgi:hypothetical protein
MTVNHDAIKRLWDAIQEDGENLDFETFRERVEQFLDELLGAYT